MAIIVDGLIYFLVVGVLIYFFTIKNIWGMGANVSNKKQAFYLSVMSSLIATTIFMILKHVIF